MARFPGSASLRTTSGVAAPYPATKAMGGFSVCLLIIRPGAKHDLSR